MTCQIYITKKSSCSRKSRKQYFIRKAAKKVFFFNSRAIRPAVKEKRFLKKFPRTIKLDEGGGLRP